MRDLPAQHRVGLGVDRLRVDEPLDQPGRRAVDEALELGRAEGRACRETLDRGRVAQARRPVERAARAAEPACPAVRVGQRDGEVGRVGIGRERGQRPQPLAHGRRLVDRQRQLRERPPSRRARHVRRVEDGRDVVPERARLQRRAVVGRRLADEAEPPRGARAGRVEEVAVAADRVGPLEPRAERAPAVVVEERRAAPAPRQRPLLEPEHEDRVEAARARAHQVEHRDAAGLRGVAGRDLEPLERADHVRRGQRLAETLPGLELVEQLRGRGDAPEVEPRRVADRRPVEPVRGGDHLGEQRAHAADRRARVAEVAQRHERRLAEALGLGLDLIWPAHRAPAQPALGEIDAGARDAGVRRAQERVELVSPRAGPGEAQQREQRVAERRRRQANAAVDRVRDAGRPEGGLERRAPAVDAGDDERDLLGRHAVAQQVEHLVGDELERAARARALEEADGAGDRRRIGGRVLEQVALEPGERGRRVLGRARLELARAPVRERGEILGRALERRERGAAGLVRQRDVDLRAAGERLEQRPLRGGEVLEAVGEDGLAVPGVELALDALARAAAQQVAVPEADAVELAAVGRVQLGDVAVEVGGIEQARLQLGDGGDERVGEPGEAGRAGKRARARANDVGRGAPGDQRALGVARDRPRLRVARDDAAEEVVERADLAAEQAAAAPRAGRARRGRRPAGWAR